LIINLIFEHRDERLWVIKHLSKYNN
jgi:hypothetical protein